MIPPSYREGVISFVEEFDLAMSRYFRGQVLISGALSVVFAVGFVLVGLPLGILLGILLGVMSMVPSLQVLGAIPAVMVAAITSRDMNMGFPPNCSASVKISGVLGQKLGRKYSRPGP